MKFSSGLGNIKKGLRSSDGCTCLSSTTLLSYKSALSTNQKGDKISNLLSQQKYRWNTTSRQDCSPQLLQAFPFSVLKASHYQLQSFHQVIHTILHLLVADKEEDMESRKMSTNKTRNIPTIDKSALLKVHRRTSVPRALGPLAHRAKWRRVLEWSK